MRLMEHALGRASQDSLHQQREYEGRTFLLIDELHNLVNDTKVRKDLTRRLGKRVIYYPYISTCMAIHLKPRARICCRLKESMGRSHGDTATLTHASWHTRTGCVENRWAVDLGVFA